MAARLMTAIVLIDSNTFRKYRNIADTEAGRKRFLNFTKNISGAKHINYYDKESKKFIERIKVDS